MLKKKIFKKFLCLILLLTMAVLQQGCWSMKELSTIAFVLATGIDRTQDGKILLTVQIARPSAFGSGGERSSSYQQNNVWVISEVGNTVLDARRELEQKVSRRIYWGHNVVLLIGEDMAKYDVKEAIDFFTRSPIVRETISVLVARGKAFEVLNSHSQLETASAQSIGQMIEQGVGVEVILKDLSVMLASNVRKNPILPVVELTPAGVAQGPGLKENLPQVKESQQMLAPLHGEPTITGSAIFKDNRLIGWFDMKETRGVLWVKNQLKQGVVTFPSVNNPDKKIAVRLGGADTTVEPFYDGEEIWFNIKAKVEGDVLEKQSDEDLSKPEIIAALDQKMSQEIEKSIRTVITTAQDEYRLDIFEFGDMFYRKYTNHWPQIKDHWDEEFANATINVTVESNIRRSGIVAK